MGKEIILLVGKRPPDYGGVSAVSDAILSSSLIKDRYHIVTVSTTHTSKHVETEKRKLRLVYILRRIRLLAVLLWRIVSIRPALVHYHTGGDLSFLSDVLNLLLLKMTGCKVIFHYHTNPNHELTLFPPHRCSSFRSKVFALAVDACDLFVTLGKTYRDYLRSLPTIKTAKIEFLYNTLPVALTTELESLRIQKKATTVLYIGRLSEQKGFYDLLSVAGLSHEAGLDVSFLVAGTANTRSEEEKIVSYMASKNPPNVELIGFAQGKKKVELLARASMFLLPSRYEGFPITILEAAAAAIPSIVYDVGMMREIVIHGVTGILVKPFSKEEIFLAISELCKDREKMRRMGESAKERFYSHFNSSIFEQRLLQLYEQALERHGA